MAAEPEKGKPLKVNFYFCNRSRIESVTVPGMSVRPVRKADRCQVVGVSGLYDFMYDLLI